MKKNRAIYITSIFMIIMTGNYLRLFSKSDIKLVELISILAIGVILGVLIVQIVQLIKDKKG